MKNILVLGVTGMLGSMVYSVLKNNNSLNVSGTFHSKNKIEPFNTDERLFEFDASKCIKEQIKDIYNKWKFNYVINCIGIIKPYCKDNDVVGVYNAIKVNSLFPHNLSLTCQEVSSNIQIIQIATDCVFTGVSGSYNEYDAHDPIDVYGKTKSLGEVQFKNIINIRCSIIGKELFGKKSLLDWFLSNKDGESVFGYDNHLWNGVTTLQFATLCENIIENKLFSVFQNKGMTTHLVMNESVSKYKLLKIFNSVFNRKIKVIKYEAEESIDRVLSTKLYPLDLIPMEEAIIELFNAIKKIRIYDENQL